MTFDGLAPAADVPAGAWIGPRLCGFGGRVCCIVPAGYAVRWVACGDRRDLDWCLPHAPPPADTDHMLELRPNCECCDRDLDPASPDVLICTYECTWCRSCAENILRGVCPNCGGELVRRPIRPAHLLALNPPSAKRVVRPGCATASAR